MPKIPDCNRCSLYAHDPHLVCGVHPFGVETDKCMDFRLHPNAKVEDRWSPQSYSWYGDELITDRPSCYSQSEQIQILDNHPFFTSICPQCTYKLQQKLVHFDCPSYGWTDDSV